MTPSPADTPTMQAFLDEARAAVFGPTALDLLSIAELRHTNPDYALKLAAAEGRRFDAQCAIKRTIQP